MNSKKKYIYKKKHTKQNKTKMKKTHKLVAITLLLPKNLRCVCIKWNAFRIGNQDDFLYENNTILTQTYVSSEVNDICIPRNTLFSLKLTINNSYLDF